MKCEIFTIVNQCYELILITACTITVVQADLFVEIGVISNCPKFNRLIDFVRNDADLFHELFEYCSLKFAYPFHPSFKHKTSEKLTQGQLVKVDKMSCIFH